MASLAEQIPKELLAPEKKAQVIEYIRATSLPSRFRRRLLQDWAEAVGVKLEAEDFMAVTDWKPGGSSLAGQRT